MNPPLLHHDSVVSCTEYALIAQKFANQLETG